MLDVCALQVRYSEFVALRGVSFTIEPGTLLGCLGPNGAGKSTLIKALVGLAEPCAGSATIDGHACGRESIESRRHVGYVPEAPRLYESLTPAEYFSFLTEVRSLDRQRAHSTVQTVAKELQLGAVLDRPIEGLSKGARQKVVIIGALLHQPKLLLLDEPTDGLDAHAVLAFHDRLRRMCQEGVAVLYCSHTLDLVERLCPEVMILHRGEVVLRDSMPSVLGAHGDQRKTLEEKFRALTGFPRDAR